MAPAPTSNEKPIKTILFDFMGTCLDWHSSITAALPTSLPERTRSDFALQWRQAYFDANEARRRAGQPPEDIDITHRRVLDELLAAQYAALKPHFTPQLTDAAITAWHNQTTWQDVSPALTALRTAGYELVVHANGTTRLQLDLARSAELRFDLLLSSELLRCYKPAPEAYQTALRLLKRGVDECVMIAAHAEDLRGAKAVGLRTVYVRRWTDDVREVQESVKGEFDAYLDDMGELGAVIERLQMGR